ncbi:MAG TPA: sigma-70 family RNA polymerase sigma factor [Acidimicrobiales bacterium]|nr:sigma-70 family RNA polymerase sigma factor [Acidimicrobiales bacterium]
MTTGRNAARRAGLGPASPPTTGPDGERRLARAFAAGDVDAVRRVYARYAGPVFTVAMGRLADRALAEEAVQEVFLKAWRARDAYDPGRELSPWLYMIARRTAADIARRERRRPATTPLVSAPVADDLGPEGDAWEAWQVRCALRDLRSEDRELIRLAHYLGLTHTEIAERTNLPIGTVKSRLHRAHRLLAQRLAHLRVIA